MDSPSERIREVLAHLPEVEAELAQAAAKARHARHEFDKELPALETWSVAKHLDEQPHFGFLA